jgi:ABC-type phosphate transport system substrate-binding protein
VLNGPETPVPLVVTSTPEVVDTVANMNGAIGYVDLGSANTANARVTAINIDGNAPTTGLVTSNSYQFWAIERMYTNKSPDAVSRSFVNFVISDIKTNGTFIRMADMRSNALLTHE